MMEMKTNAYGNTLIVYDKTKKMPEFKNNEKNHIIITDGPDDFMHEHLPYFIAKTKLYGNIFGNVWSRNHFPVINQEDELQGACSVVFTKYKSETYVILVQGKNKKFIMNPAGFMSANDKSLRDCAARELFEETSLQVLKDNNWKQLASWRYKTNFAGLSFIGYTLCGIFWIDELPLHWIPKGDVTLIHQEDPLDEIESVILLNVKSLPDYKKLNTSKKFPTSFGGHHFNLVLKAAIYEGLIDKEHQSLQEVVSYLTTFDFHI